MPKCLLFFFIYSSSLPNSALCFHLKSPDIGLKKKTNAHCLFQSFCHCSETNKAPETASNHSRKSIQTKLNELSLDILSTSVESSRYHGLKTMKMEEVKGLHGEFCPQEWEENTCCLKWDQLIGHLDAERACAHAR